MITEKNKTREKEYTCVLVDKETHWKIKTLALEKRTSMLELIRQVFNSQSKKKNEEVV